MVIAIIYKTIDPKSSNIHFDDLKQSTNVLLSETYYHTIDKSVFFDNVNCTIM